MAVYDLRRGVAICPLREILATAVETRTGWQDPFAKTDPEMRLTTADSYTSTLGRVRGYRYKKDTLPHVGMKEAGVG